jgi:hypothetical protein
MNEEEEEDLVYYLGCDYIESDSETLICPNCDSEFVVARSFDLMDLMGFVDEDTFHEDTFYIFCPICIKSAKLNSFRDFDED